MGPGLERALRWSRSWPASPVAVPVAVIPHDRKMRRTLSRQLTAETSREVQGSYRSRIKEDLDRGNVWAFKTFYLFPLLVRLRYLDHVFRVVFPLAYVIYVLVSLSEVEFGLHQLDKINNGPVACR